AANLSNSTAVGNQAISNASNKVRLGNTLVTVVEGQVPYSNPSDARFKSNIKENVPGLDFILKLKPVTYNFDTKKFADYLHQNITDSLKTDLKNNDYSESTAIIRSGFLAQDIEKIIKEIGYDFDGLHIPEIGNSTDTYSVAYSQFIMPIVKSIQEQQTIIETQKNQIANLQKENAELKREQEKQKQTLEKIIQKLIELEKK
ncbi:MAG TPA: tail fiber domain-containing protein, partial [Flavobacterium sp.]|nr:tail fiber domain-containing protein [Flavobacterium sp.]